MGVSRLIPNLYLYTKKLHIKGLNNCSVGVDAKAWLYKGAESCALQLARGQPTTGYLTYLIDRLELLQYYGLIPTMVFDGGPLGAKVEESQERARRREEHLKLGFELESSNYSEAMKHFKMSVRISSDMMYNAIQELKKRHVKYIVAPYEADAQLAFLSKKGKVAAVFSDDSDMVPYACKRVFRNLDSVGNCWELKYESFSRYKELCKRKRRSDSFDLSEFTHEMIITMCVLGGCDYLKNAEGVNIQMGYEMVKRWKENYIGAIQDLKREGIIFPENYTENFRRAVKMYKHQVVFDPECEMTVHLSECREDEEDLSYFGEMLTQVVAREIAFGIRNPYTRLAYRVAPATSEQEEQVEKDPIHYDKMAEEEKEVTPAGKGICGTLGLLKNRGMLEGTRDIDVGIVKENEEIRVGTTDENLSGIKRKFELGEMVYTKKTQNQKLS